MRRQLAALAAAAAASALLLAIVVLPGLELAAESARAERTLGYALSFPLPLRAALIGLFNPSRGSHDAYLGAAVMALAAASLALAPQRDGRASLFFAGVAGRVAGALLWRSNSAPPLACRKTFPVLVSFAPQTATSSLSHSRWLCSPATPRPPSSLGRAPGGGSALSPAPR